MQNDISKVTRTTESIGFPEVILIDNFNGCNLKCSMCDHRNIKKYRKIQRMDFSLYKKLVDEIAVERPESTVYEIFFGEPFLCVDMPKRIAYAKAKGLKRVVVNTNGVYMTPEESRLYIMAGLDEIYVGIDAFNEETYKQIRVGGDYHKVGNNVLAYRDLLKQYGRNGQKIYVQFVESELNAKETEPFKQFWADQRVGVKIRPKISWAGLIDASNLTEDNQKNRKPCYWLMRTINVCADGTVALCSADLHRRVNCGDTNKGSMKDIWNGRLARYRVMHREGRWGELPEICKNCRDWQSTYSEAIG